MNQEQKQEALERFQESQRIIEEGILKAEEMQQLHQDELDRRNNEEYKRKALTPYTSDTQISNLTAQKKSSGQYEYNLDDSKACWSIQDRQESLMTSVISTLEGELEEYKSIYRQRKGQMESNINHLGYQIQGHRQILTNIAQEIETLSESEDQS